MVQLLPDISVCAEITATASMPTSGKSPALRIQQPAGSRGRGPAHGRPTVARRRQFAALVLIAAVAAGWWWWSRHDRSDPMAWQGYAEADYVKVGPTQQGLLTAVTVARGDLVVAGTALYAQAGTEDRAARDRAARQLAQAEEQLANLLTGGKATEIAQAEANLRDANATLERTRADLQRDEALVRTGAVSVQTVDQRR